MTQRAWTIAAHLVITLFVGAAHLSAIGAKNPISLRDLEVLAGSPYDRAVEISSNGQWIAIERSGELIVVSVNQREETVNLGDGIFPKWSPAGEDLAFYSTRSGERQLWIYHLGDASPHQITDIAGGVDPDPTTRVSGYFDEAFRFSWAPHGQTIVFPSRVALPSDIVETHRNKSTTTKQKGDTPIILTNSTPYSLTMAGIAGESATASGIPEVKTGKALSFRRADADETLFNQLFMVDIETSTITQLTTGRRSAFHPAWSPDGSVIGFAAVEGSLLNSHVTSGEIVLLDPITGNERVLVSNKRINYYPSWSNDGTYIAYLSKHGSSDWPKIHVSSRSTGREVVRGPRDFDRRIYDYAWHAGSTQFFLHYKDGVSSRIDLIDLGTNKVTPVTPKDELPYRVSWLSQSKTGALIWRQTDPEALETIRIFKAQTESPEVIWQPRGSQKAYALGRVEVFRWRNSRGEAREGTVLLPPNFRSGRRYPMIVDAYPLRSGADWTKPMGGNYAWASAGYVIFRPSGRGPHVWMNAWKDLASSRAAIGPKGWDLAYDDVMSGVDALIERGIVHPDRMCLFGYSNGGGVVTHIISQTNRFRCAVIVAPAMTNWIRFPLLNLEDEGWVKRYAGGRSLEDALEDYVQLSPVLHLGNVKTPVLLAAGDNDHSFLLNAIEVYNRLRANGTRVTLLRYPNEGHVFSSAVLADFWGREMGFFAEHLQRQTADAE